MYLMKYGYMDHHKRSNKSAPLLSRDGLRDYVEKFQGFAGGFIINKYRSTFYSIRTTSNRRAGQKHFETYETT